MKKENIPNALTLIRVVMIPILLYFSLSHSYSRTYCSSQLFLQLQVFTDIWMASMHENGMWLVILVNLQYPMADKLIRFMVSLYHDD